MHDTNETQFQTTIAFNFIVLQTVANTFCMRVTFGEYNFFIGLDRNPWFWGIVGLEICLQVGLFLH